MIAALLLQAAAPPASQADIVVVARQRRCQLQRGGMDLSTAQLARLERQWAAGEEVRIHVAAGARTRCLARLMFRLADRGITRVTFVDEDQTSSTSRP